MKAVILVGGEGTRLRPLTCNLPKPMLPVVNRPFLEHVLSYLKRHNIKDIILSMCYRPDVIQEYFGDGGAFGVKLTYVVEEKPLGTAGGVKNVESYLDDTFFVFNGDILTDLDLTAMHRFHREKKARVTIALTPVEDPTAYGLVETDAENKVRGFIEKPSWDRVTTNLINAGTYIVEPEVFRYVPPKVYYMFEHGLFPVLLQMDDPLYGYPSNAYWIDIGTPAKYITVHHDLLTGRIRKRLPGEQMHDGVWVGDGCQIHPSVKLTGPIVLGNHVTIGSGVVIIGPVVVGDYCDIGRDTVVEDVVIWEKTVIRSHVMMKSCVVARSCTIEDNTWITHGAIVADNCVIGVGNKIEQGIKIWPNRTIESNTITF
ncbi:MAG: NDP-sugar synthase [Chloroflexi bacterium]|nr:NDP-sugar synthase [Chloroflexota bacterium]MCL5074028.1 NDP-sugar synthase [Chloroflexota bacterium]